MDGSIAKYSRTGSTLWWKGAGERERGGERADQTAFMVNGKKLSQDTEIHLCLRLWHAKRLNKEG